MGDDIRFEVIKKVAATKFKFRDISKISKLNSNSPPSVFVGSGLQYPNVNVGILSPLERDSDSWVYDDMQYWAQNNFSINDVVKLREGLLNSRFVSKVQDSRLKNNFVSIAQEIALSSKPVDVEIELKNKMILGKKVDKILTPHGMRAPLKKAVITENVRVDKKLDRMINDEVKATKGIEYLYKNKFSGYVLSKVLSVGVLGLKKDKKFVPTRWSITATDDIISKKLLEEVRQYKWINNHELFFGSFMGNHYLIMLIPSVFSFELFELYFPGSSWNPGKEIKASTDSEGFGGRKNYAKATAGGYYATRLGILEYLKKIKRQASVLVIRLETPSYWAALGVWVVRESVRKAMNNRNLKFDSIDELIQSSKKVGMIKFGYDNTNILKKSWLLEQLRTQTRLADWF